MAFPAELFLTRGARDDGMRDKVPHLPELSYEVQGQMHRAAT